MPRTALIAILACAAAMLLVPAAGWSAADRGAGDHQVRPMCASATALAARVSRVRLMASLQRREETREIPWGVSTYLSEGATRLATAARPLPALARRSPVDRAARAAVTRTAGTNARLARLYRAQEAANARLGKTEDARAQLLAQARARAVWTRRTEAAARGAELRVAAAARRVCR